jgi:two-component system response regulator AgrA
MEKIIGEALKGFNNGASITLSTDKPEAVLEHLEFFQKQSFIYFLDVHFGTDMNGIELARRIRQVDPHGYIVFVTSHAELTLLTFQYKVQALDYIVKSDTLTLEKKIRGCLAAAFEGFNTARVKDKEEEKIITINSADSLIKLKLDQVLFFETTEKEHKIRVHTSTEQIEFYGTLKQIEKQVTSDYYKPHRSYLVNTKNIKSIDKKKLVMYMVNGETCYISLRYLKGLIEKCSV